MRAYLWKSVAVIVFVLILGIAPSQGVAAENPKGKGSPAVRMREWKNSTDEEKRFFLLGFVTMLEELKKERQENTPISPGCGDISKWTKGLNGLSPNQMREAIDAYVSANPDDNDTPVSKFLWFHYVHPKLLRLDLSEPLDPHTIELSKPQPPRTRNK